MQYALPFKLRGSKLILPLLVKSGDRPYPSCTLSTDLFHLPTINTSIPLPFAYCRPSKFSVKTLGASGSTLGLAPSEHLRQIKSASLLQQLVEKEIIERPIFSLMLINAQEGVLSIGGTGANAIRLADQQTKDELDLLGAIERGEITANAAALDTTKQDFTKRTSKPAGKTAWEEDWQWSKVQGADGWWQTLLQGIWVDGNKILQNQAAVIDVPPPNPPSLPPSPKTNTFPPPQLNTPFILAPPSAVQALYGSISGSSRLPPPHSNFHTYPCLNPPDLHLEFNRRTFPLLRGRGATWTGIPGGKFSLGRVRDGSGYCVGAVVESGLGRGGGGGGGGGRGGLDGNGMRDVWVVGEGFFRGVGVVFDVSILPSTRSFVLVAD